MVNMSDTEVRVGKLPTCIFCKQDGRKIDAEFDGATKKGPWAFMCKEHFDEHGVGIGLGVGQHLVLASNGVRRLS